MSKKLVKTLREAVIPNKAGKKNGRKYRNDTKIYDMAGEIEHTREDQLIEENTKMRMRTRKRI